MGRIKAGIFGLAAIAAVAGELVLPTQAYKLRNEVVYEKNVTRDSDYLTAGLAAGVILLSALAVYELGKKKD